MHNKLRIELHIPFDSLRMLRTLFDAALAASPLSSVGQVVHRLAAEHWPGYELSYDTETVGRFLKREVSVARPLFFLQGHEARAVVDPFLQAISDQNDPRLVPFRPLRWLARLACHTHPWARDLLDELIASFCCEPEMQDVVEQINELLGSDGPIQIRESDWPPFRNAFFVASECEWVLPVLQPDDVRGDIPLFDGVYSLRDAEVLGQKLLDYATPFEGPAGKVLVFPCNDAGSLKHMNAAANAVKCSSDLSLPEALCRELYSARETKRIIRQHNVNQWNASGVGSRQMARWIVKNCFTERRSEDEEDGFGSAYRQVRRDLDDLRKEGGLAHNPFAADDAEQ
jgi:hypothetical protein